MSAPDLPSAEQINWLRRGLDQPGGKLPLFDEDGQRVHTGVVQSCITSGWAERWFHNPLKPDWEVCRLTEAGRMILANCSYNAANFHRGETPRS